MESKNGVRKLPPPPPPFSDSSSSSCTYSDESYEACEEEEEKFGEYDSACYQLPYCEESPRSTGSLSPFYAGDVTFGEEPFSAYSESPSEERPESRAPSFKIVPQEPYVTKKSIFVHSSPLQFPDIRQASRSVFGSIFVKRTTQMRASSPVQPKRFLESEFSIMPPIFERVESLSDGSDSGMASMSKDPVFRAFEKRGLAWDASQSSTSNWDIYPITESTLFTLHTRGRVHQTRNISKVEERMANMMMQMKFAHLWPTGSTWTGNWDILGMAGAGTYVMPHDVCYVGKMQDGMCHDNDATLIYPNGFKALHCNYVKGVLTDYQFQFPDLLDHEKSNWKYCQYPDRRFWSEVQTDLKPAKVAQKTQLDPPRKIPPDSYDTNDGFYNPKTKMLVNAEGELLRVPTCEEENWIKSKCRKGFHEFTGFCPDLYENWFDDDKELIDSIIEMQKRYFDGEISYEELNQFFADRDMLPSFSPFRKEAPTESDEMSSPQPKKLVHRLEKRYEGHKIKPSEESIYVDIGPHRNFLRKSRCMESSKELSTEKLSSRIRFNAGSQTTVSVAENDSRSILKKYAKKEKEVPPPLPPQPQPPPPPPPPPVASPSEQSSDSLKEVDSDTSEYRRRTLQRSMKGIVMGVVEDILLREREKLRDRFVRAQSLSNIPFGPRDNKEKCAQVLTELYDSIGSKTEFCDSVKELDCDLRMLARDRLKMVQYWGKRIFTLNFDEEFYD